MSYCMVSYYEWRMEFFVFVPLMKSRRNLLGQKSSTGRFSFSLSRWAVRSFTAGTGGALPTTTSWNLLQLLCSSFSGWPMIVPCTRLDDEDDDGEKKKEGEQPFHCILHRRKKYICTWCIYIFYNYFFFSTWNCARALSVSAAAAAPSAHVQMFQDGECDTKWLAQLILTRWRRQDSSQWSIMWFFSSSSSGSV